MKWITHLLAWQALKSGEQTDGKEAATPTDCLYVLEQLITKILPQKTAFDTVKDVQILTPMKKTDLGTDKINQMIQQSVVGYSLSYPMGVLGVMIGIAIMQRLLKVDFSVI